MDQTRYAIILIVLAHAVLLLSLSLRRKEQGKHGDIPDLKISALFTVMAAIAAFAI
jgi:hypothetical protein